MSLYLQPIFIKINIYITNLSLKTYSLRKDAMIDLRAGSCLPYNSHIPSCMVNLHLERFVGSRHNLSKLDSLQNIFLEALR